MAMPAKPKPGTRKRHANHRQNKHEFDPEKNTQKKKKTPGDSTKCGALKTD
jgi:hypothetical protein